MKFNRSIVSAVVACSIFAAAVGAGPADSMQAAQTAITVAQQNQCKLLEAGDIGGYLNTLTPDFQATDPSGKTQTRDQNAVELKQQFSEMNLKVTGCDFTIEQVRPTGSDVSVTVSTVTDGTVAAPSGQVAPIHIETRETDVWTNQGGAWLQRSSVEQQSTIKLNGQVVQTQGSPG